MKLTVKLFANFRDGRFKEEPREYPDGTTIGAITDGLGIARAQVGALFVNGRHGEFDRAACADDIVAIFPIVGGG